MGEWPTGIDMDDRKAHVVHCVNGRLHEGNPDAATTRDDVRKMIADALAKSDAPELVIHFHGGLVNRKAAYELAGRLIPRYESETRYPIFFAWESGFIEAIRNNLQDISKDPLFRQLAKKVSWWVLKQLPGAANLRAVGGGDSQAAFEQEFDAYFSGTGGLPEAFTITRESVASLKNAGISTSEGALQPAIQVALEGDPGFKRQLKAIAAGIVDEPIRKASGVGQVVSTTTEIAPESVDELFDGAQGRKSVFGFAKLAWFIAKLVVRVVRRLASGQGHGFYTTVVEEILAGAYLDKVGGVIWNQMKKDTLDSFASPDKCAGAALLAEIQAHREAGKSFRRITLVGHSTGAVYISNLLAAAEKYLSDQKFDVVFLAPAVTYEFFAETLAAHRSRINGFRRFGMQDSVEADDVLVPIVYIQSLLYFISGVLEFTAGPTPERIVDAPLVGMQRYGSHAETFSQAKFPAIHDVESFIAGFRNGSVWSVTQDGTALGISSHSRKHGDFDNDDATIDSIVEILDEGF